MTTMTLVTAITGGQDPDYYAGRADAYDEHGAGASIAELLVRSEYIGDLHPSAAYGRGYSAYVAGARLERDVEQDAHRIALTHNDAYWPETTPRLRGRALLDAKTVAIAEATHRRRLGITQAAWNAGAR